MVAFTAAVAQGDGVQRKPWSFILEIHGLKANDVALGFFWLAMGLGARFWDVLGNWH